MSRSQRAPRRRTQPVRAPSPGRGGPRRGPRVGPVRITALRVTLAVAMAGGLAFLAWSVFVRDANQVPMMATGFAVCGLVFAVVSVMSVGRIISAGREGRDGTAVATALVGGLMAIAAMMLVAGAVIMSMIWIGTSSG